MTRSSNRVRRWREVSHLALSALVGIFALHGIWRANLTPQSATLSALDSPPSLPVMRIAALGDEISYSKEVMLWLQAFDTQPGLRIPLRALDYGRVIAWLTRCLELDPQAQYPLLAASRLYAEIPDENRARKMLEFVHTSFAHDPARRWPWLAHAVYLAKHRLKDRELALKFARSLAAADEPSIPHWAQQLEIFVLADMGEVEAAKVLLGGLLASGKIADPHEQRFLTQRLHDLTLSSHAKP